VSDDDVDDNDEEGSTSATDLPPTVIASPRKRIMPKVVQPVHKSVTKAGQHGHNDLANARPAAVSQKKNALPALTSKAIEH
jgi:hypothetical protein